MERRDVHEDVNMPIGADGHYSYREILGYNRKYSFILSDRGPGKTYGYKHLVVSDPYRFMIVYRDTLDMKLAMDSWLGHIEESGKYNMERFRIEGSKDAGYCLFLDDAIKGYFRALTQVAHIKNEHFPQHGDDVVHWVVMDEFISIKRGALKGIEDEGVAFEEIIKTLDHDRAHTRTEKGLPELRCIFCANPWTWDSQILRHWGIRPQLGISKQGKDVVLEILPPSGRDTHSAIDRNLGYMLEGMFIEPLPKGVGPSMSLRMGRNVYKVYAADGLLWVIPSTEHVKSEFVYGTIEGKRAGERPARMIIQEMVHKYDNCMLRFRSLNDKFGFMNDTITFRQG